MTMSLTERLATLFGNSCRQRAQDLLTNQQLMRLKLDQKLKVLTGVFHGPEGSRIHTEIDFECDRFRAPDHSVGECSCSAGYNCHHACALLQASADEYGEAAILALIDNPPDTTEPVREPDVPKYNSFDLNELMAMMDGRKKNTLTPAQMMEIIEDLGGSTNRRNNDGRPEQEQQRALNHWLNALKNHDRVTAADGAGKSSPQNNKFTLYLLGVDTYQQAFINLTVSRRLKNGGFGAPSDFAALYNGIHQQRWPKYVNEDDQLILRQAWVHQVLNEYPSRIILKGTVGRQLLDQILATGRCAVDVDNRLPVTASEPMAGEIRWRVNEQGLQRPALVNRDNGQFLNLLSVDPPCYLRVNDHTAEVGELTGLPPSDLVKLILQAPPLDNDAAEQAGKTLEKLLPQPKPTKGQHPKKDQRPPVNVHLPKPVQTRTLEPVPELVLDAVESGDLPAHGQGIARGQLYFRYGDERVAWDSPLDSLMMEDPKQGQLAIPRQRTREEAFIVEYLQDWLQPAQMHQLEAPFQPGDLVMGLHGPDYQRGWLKFMTLVIPLLEPAGFTLHIADNFPFQLEHLTDSNWYAELDESEQDWFTLRLGIRVGDQDIDLMPVLARELDHLPPLEQLKAMAPDTPVPVPLPGNRYVTLPAERLTLMLATLTELFGDRVQSEYRLNTWHADAFADLHKMGLEWAGEEKLLAISEKLKHFKKIRAVKPPKGLQATLRPYQRKGLAWLQFLRDFGFNGILADDMGLGKTLQTLAHLLLEKERLGAELKPSLIVAPTSLLPNWRREAERFTPDLSLTIYHGADRNLSAITGADLAITSFGTLHRDADKLKNLDFHYLVLDEAQAIKNPVAKTSRATRELKADHRLCLTGTPMENHLGELWSLFDFLMPGFLGMREQFTRHYRTPIEKLGDKPRSQLLRRRVAPFMLRRNKNLVAKELPPRTEIIRTTALGGKQRDLYESIRSVMEKRVQQEIAKKGIGAAQIMILDALLKMRQTCCDPSLVKLEEAKKVKASAKLELLMELLIPMVEEGRRILVFSQFTSMLALIESRLKTAGIGHVKLTGQTKNRDIPVDRFQSGKVPVFLISLKAGGTGLNLTAADTVIHYDPWWNPAVEDQASDRAHRIGQNKPVFIYKLVTEGTVEEKIQQLKERKKAIAASLYGEGKQQKNTITAEDLEVLFEPLQPAE